MTVLLALDPSSTCTGYAVMRGKLHLVDAGVLRSARDGAMLRALDMADDLDSLVAEHGVTDGVIETPAKQAPMRRGKDGKLFNNPAGQAVYGMAVGIILAQLWRLLPGRVVTSGADVWTRRVKKEHRQRCVAYDFPSYRAARDTGADCADAIALGQWWWMERINAAQPQRSET